MICKSVGSIVGRCPKPRPSLGDEGGDRSSPSEAGKPYPETPGTARAYATWSKLIFVGAAYENAQGVALACLDFGEAPTVFTASTT
jgi:hypothetical protein